MFITDEINENGIYALTMYNSGRKITVVVDDYIACREGQSIPAFTKGNGCELWVLLAEKAYAKIHGSFKRIVSGKAYIAMADLTGAPSYLYPMPVGKICDY